MNKATKINASAQARIAEYVALAAALDVRTSKAATIRKTLVSLGYERSEIASQDALVEAARQERTAMLHRARAVKSTAKRRAA